MSSWAGLGQADFVKWFNLELMRYVAGGCLNEGCNLLTPSPHEFETSFYVVSRPLGAEGRLAVDTTTKAVT